MKLLNFVAPAALIAAMSVSGGALAQTMVGGHDVSDDELPRVQAHCAALEVAATQSLVDDAGTDTDDDNDPNQPGDPDPAATTNGDADGIDQALTTIDLNTITLEQCREAELAQPGRIVVN
jgi:hypothetical protein